MKRNYLAVFGVTGVLTAAAACGGMYLGAVVYTQWLGLKTEPSVMLLPAYWAHSARLPAAMMLPLQVSTALAAAIPLAVSVLSLVAVFAKPRRELHGSARFANRSEIQKTGLLKEKFQPEDAPDLLVGKYGGQFLRWSSKEFAYLAAPTRSGKGVGIVIPNLLHYRDSVVVYDPKMENFLITAGFRAKHGQEVFLFNPGGRMPEHERNPNAPLVSHRWNPLTYVRRNPTYTYKDALGVAAIMYPDPVNAGGSAMFFAEAARKLFAGLLMYLIETEPERDLSLQENRTTMANLFRLCAPTNGKTLAEWIRDEIELRSRSPQAVKLSGNCITLLSDFANGNAKTGADIVATVTAPLGIFIDPVVEAATGGDDFRLDDVRKKRMTVYLGVLPTETAVFARLTNLFFSLLANVNVYQGLPENNPGILKYQCLMLMDEFTALGVVPAIEHGVSYLAGYNMRLLPIFQTPSQMEKLYQKTGMRTFFTNFGCQIVFPPRDQSDAEEYSRLVGYQTFKAKSSSRSHGKSSSRSNSVSDQKRAVMNPDELKMMPKEDCIISLGSSRPIYAQKIVYWQDPVLSKRANLTLPEVPVLQLDAPKRAAPQAAVKAEYLAPEELDGFHWQDGANAEDFARSILAAIVPPGSPPEYVAELVPVVAQNWGEGSLPVIAAILQDTAGINPTDLPQTA